MDLYYPSDRNELLGYCKCEQKEGHTPSLILLPHSSLEFIHSMYQDAFSVLTPLGGVHIEQIPGVKINDEYAEREYAIEIFYPYVACNSPQSIIMPLFTCLESKDDILTLSRLMVKLKKEENDTLFIVSGNFTALGTSEEINSMAKTLKELLENNAPLLEAGSKKKISGCAYKIMEAARTAFPGRFTLNAARCGNYIGENISTAGDGRIWQVYGVKE